MQKGQKATNGAHRGVQIISKGTKLVLRFKDPIERRYRDQTLGEVSRSEAVEAAIAKKEALEAIKRRWIAGELTATPEGVDQIQEFIDSADTQGTKRVREVGAKYLRTMQQGMLTRSWHELQRHDLLRLHKIILGDKNLGPTTQNLRLRTCKTFFNWMHDRGALGSVTKDLIGLSLKNVKAPEHVHGRILQPHEMQTLFATMLGERPEVGLFFLLKLLTGLRIGELVNIRVKDIISSAGVKPHLLVTAPKTNRTRKVNLSASPLAHCILENLKGQSKDYIFLPSFKDRSDPVPLYRRFQRHLVRTISKKTHFKINPKDLRATNEALLATLEGWDIFKVAKQLGHSTAIANRSYTEDIQMMDFPSGSSIEEVAGLMDIGQRMLKANKLNPNILDHVLSQNEAMKGLHQSSTKLILGELSEWIELDDVVPSVVGMELEAQHVDALKARITDAFAQRMVKASTEEQRKQLQDKFFRYVRMLDARRK